MNALLLREYMKLELVQMPAPDVGPDDVLVRVAACGICGSDVHGMDGSTGRRLPPLVMGHEAAGRVARAGANVRGLREGDRVTFDSTISCGSCPYCARGEFNLCDRREVLGVSPGEYRRHGAFAEYVSIPARIVYRLPDHLPFEHAALIEAVSVALHAVRITPVQPGDAAAVSGAGMIGLLAIQALRHAGCGTVIAFDLDGTRLALARRLGATHALDAQAGDPAGAIRDLTGGRGVDVAIECVGTQEPLQALIRAVRKGGAITLVGNLAPTVGLPLQAVVSRQIRLQGSCASNGEYPVALDLMSQGILQVAPLISAVAPLAEGPAWFDRLYRGEPNLMKVVLQP
jgi:L-iditol 2-dehydrogenase